jgi:hypothetical protein
MEQTPPQEELLCTRIKNAYEEIKERYGIRSALFFCVDLVAFVIIHTSERNHIRYISAH